MKHISFPVVAAQDPTQDLILDHAFDLFTREGMKGFTVESLAKELTMSKKTIYKYFPSKEVLLKGMFQHIMKKVAGHFVRILALEMNPLDKFLNILDAIFKTANDLPITKLGALKARYPSIWKEIETFRLARRDDFYQLMQEGREQNLVRKDVDIEMAATLFMTIINQVFQPEFFIQNQYGTREVIVLFRNIYLRGILSDKGLNYMKEKL